MFHELLKPMLVDAGTEYDLIVTTGAGHAMDIAKSFALEKIGAIAVIGGDGLFGEVMNGLNSRSSDRAMALKIPVGIIPAGSSNCLACSVGLRQPLASAFAVARGHVKPLDVLKVTMLDDSKVLLSVCGVSYGFISEVNTHAGHWRWLFGPARYSICGLRTFLTSPMTYHVNCRYKLPCENESREFDTCECGPDCRLCVLGDSSTGAVVSSPLAASSMEGGCSSEDTASPSARVDFSVDTEWKESSVVLEPRRQRFNRLSSDTMLLFSLTNLSIRQSQNKTVWNANSHMASGYMDLVMIPVISRMQLLKFFRAFSKGGNFHKADTDVFSVIKAKSVEMAISKSFDQLPEWERRIQIAIDGEVYPLQPLRVDTIQGLLSLMCA